MSEGTAAPDERRGQGQHAGSLGTAALSSTLVRFQDPLTDAEGATAALLIMAESMDVDSVGVGVAYLADRIHRHLAELRAHWHAALAIARGGACGDMGPFTY